MPLPKNAQQLWAQHKYSVMARDIASYKNIGAWVTTKNGAKNISEVSLELTKLLRIPPSTNLIENSLLHMWGYVSEYSTSNNPKIALLSNKSLLNKIQQLAMSNNVQYLVESTALSELQSWGI